MRYFTRVLLAILFLLPFCEICSQDGKKSKTEETEASQIVLTVNGDSLHIENSTPGAALEVYNILGVKIACYKIDSRDKTLILKLPKGCYILKIEDIVRKIAINK